MAPSVWRLWQRPVGLLGLPSGRRTLKFVLGDAYALDEAFVSGVEGQGQTIVDREFFEDIVQVELHRPCADGQGVRNALIA